MANIVAYIRCGEPHGIGIVGRCDVEIVVEINVGTAEKGILAVVGHPLSHHTVEPHSEPRLPLLQVGLHPVGKIAYVVVAVPFVRQVEDIVVNGVNRPYARRVEIYHYIFGTDFYASHPRVQRQSVDKAHVSQSPPPICVLFVDPDHCQAVIHCLNKEYIK